MHQGWPRSGAESPECHHLSIASPDRRARNHGTARLVDLACVSDKPRPALRRAEADRWDQMARMKSQINLMWLRYPH